MSLPVLCLSDTAWHHRHRRLFHVMSALAASRRVYVLEPQARPCRMSLLGAARAGAVTVLTPYLPAGVDRRTQCQLIAPLLEAVLDNDSVLAPLVWVRDADALPVVDRLATVGTLYDYPALSACPRPTRAERDALQRADVVLAASAAQADWLRRWHPRVQHVPTKLTSGGAATAPPRPSITAALEELIDERLPIRRRHDAEPAVAEPSARSR
jgi:hypothetical protein